MTRVTLHHLIGRLKTGISDLSHTELLMVSLLSRDDRCVCSQWEVNAWIRHQVGLERQNIMSHIDPPLFTKLQIEIGKGRSLVSKDELCATYNVLNVALANGSENYFLEYPCESKLASHHQVFVKAFKGTRQPVRNSSLVKFFLALRQFYRECESSTYLELVCARRLNQNIPGTQLNQHSGHHQNEGMLWWKTQSAQSDGSG